MKLKDIPKDKKYLKGILWTSLALIFAYPIIPLFQNSVITLEGFLMVIPFSFIGVTAFSLPLKLMKGEE